MVDEKIAAERLTDPSFFAGDDYHQFFKELRDENPVMWTESPNYGRGFWSVFRYEDCQYVLERPDLFSNYEGVHLPPDGRSTTDEERIKMGWDVMLPFIDPPVHTQKRRAVNPHFSVPAVERLHEDCERIVDMILSRVAARGEAEVVSDLAALLPANLFLTMMDIPRDRWDDIRATTMRMMHPEDAVAAGWPETDLNKIVADSWGDIAAYVSQHTISKRGQTGVDFATTIANMKVRGELLPERDAGFLGFTMVGAGLETTRNAAAVAFYELMRHPDQAALLQDDEIAKSAVEEVIRWVTPSKNRLRLALQDTELGGYKIRKGDWVVAWIVSGNRDERVFTNPQQFDITRNPNPHLGFGQGNHMCLGRNIARLELRILLQRAFAAFPDMHPAGEPEWVASTNTTGLKRLPVAFTPVSVPVGA